jgi:hypothetical protein
LVKSEKEMNTEQQKTMAYINLEEMIDKNSLRTVLELIAEICTEKAAHIEANWQDKSLAKLWEQCGNRVAELSINFKVGLVSK